MEPRHRLVPLIAAAVVGLAGSATASTPKLHGSNFWSNCRFSHTANDDPIVVPRLPGRSHPHTFFGNASTGAYSTLASLRRASTTCKPRADKAAYWVPTLYRNGREVRPAEGAGSSQGQALSGEALEKEIWQSLKTCYDPEIPVNIVDLGLIYDMHVDKLADGARVEIKMTLTAQGCGMGTSIAADARNKILDLPGVVEADVQVVWDPPWGPEKISPEGRALLGIH